MRSKRVGAWGGVAAAVLCIGLGSGVARAQPAPAPAASAARGAGATPAAPASKAGTARGATPAPPPGATPAASAAPKPLSESLTGMAKAEYGAGVVLFKEGDMVGALEKFERAHELARDHRLLWNVALCEKNLRRYTRMLATLQRLEEEGGNALTAQDRQDIADLVKATEMLVNRLDITTNEPGAAVFIDDVAVGTTPLAGPVPVDIGVRRIRITKPGFKDFLRTETVVGGKQAAIAAKLEKAVHRGRLIVTAGAADLIAIDGKVVGRGQWEGVLPSGAHALRVTAPGMDMHRSDVLIQDDEFRRVQITLNPAPEPTGSSKWLWIGGGAALLAGAVIAGALLFEPGKPAEQGSLGSLPLSVHFGGGTAFAGSSAGGTR